MGGALGVTSPVPSKGNKDNQGYTRALAHLMTSRPGSRHFGFPPPLAGFPRLADFDRPVQPLILDIHIHIDIDVGVGVGVGVLLRMNLGGRLGGLGLEPMIPLCHDDGRTERRSTAPILRFFHRRKRSHDRVFSRALRDPVSHCDPAVSCPCRPSAILDVILDLDARSGILVDALNGFPTLTCPSIGWRAPWCRDE